MSRKCTIDGCEKKHVARGWCQHHYDMWSAYGDPLAPGVGRRGTRKKQEPEECMVGGCERPQRSTGLCEAHSRQFRRNGTLTTIREYRRKGEGDGGEE